MALSGRPMLERQLERLERCARADEVVLAVTTNADDPEISALNQHIEQKDPTA